MQIEKLQIEEMEGSWKWIPRSRKQHTEISREMAGLALTGKFYLFWFFLRSLVCGKLDDCGLSQFIWELKEDDRSVNYTT